MSQPYFQQQNFIPQETANPITWSQLKGFSCFGIDVTGTFTAGSFTIQGSNDGVTFTILEIESDGTILDDGVIDATGHYTVLNIGYNMAKLVPSTSPALNATLVLSSLGALEVAPAFSGLSPLNPVVDSLTITGMEGALAANSTGRVYPVEGASGDVMRQSGTGTGQLDAAAYTGTRYIAVGQSSGIYTSTNGTSSWLQRTSPASGEWFSVAWNGSIAVATGQLGIIATSPDGITWTSRTSGVALNLASVTWDGTNFIAVGSGQTVITSPDGITWTSRTFGTTVAIRGVASTTTLAVAVCAGGTIKTSTDHGVTWTSRTSGVATTLWKVAVNTGGTLWTAVGDTGVILTSPDGITWTSRTSGAGTTALNNVAFGNSLWTVIGDTGTILTSPDGTTWTAQTSGTTGNLYGIVYGTLWLAVGVAVKLTSSDTITWTAVAQNVWIASTPTGTGQLVTTAGANTFTGLRTFTDGLSSPGNINTGIAVAGTITGLNANYNALTSASTNAIVAINTGALTATTVVRAIFARASVIAGLATAKTISFLASAPTVGAGGSIVEAVGLEVESITQGGINTAIKTGASGNIQFGLFAGGIERPIRVDVIGNLVANIPNTTFNNTAITVLPGLTSAMQMGTMSASRIVTLPAASAVIAGTIIRVVDISGTVTALNSLVVTAAGADTINAGTTSTIVTAYGSSQVMSDGISKWIVIGLI